MGGATALQIDPGGVIVSTTPETDPTNSDPANKGIIENAADVDLFSFRLMDSDGDTMDDDWERTYFLSIGASDGGPDDDWDGDGFIDAHEFRANTIPTDAKSLLTIVNIWPDVPNECVIQWQSASNRTYSVQRSTNMPAEDWVPAASSLPGSPPLNEHTVSVDKVRSLYRIMLDE